MITVRDLGEFPRVYREDEGETMVEMIEVMNDKEVNSDNEDKDKNLCVLNVKRKQWLTSKEFDIYFGM